MTWLVEDPWPVMLIGGAVVGVLLLMLYVSGRGVWLVAAAVALALVVGLVIVERLVVTEREEVEQTLVQMAAALERNDVEGLVAHFAPTAAAATKRVRSELRRIRVDEASIVAGPEVRIVGGQPLSAEARLAGRLNFNDTAGRIPYQNYLGRMMVRFQKQGDRWLMTEYSLDAPGL